MEAQIDEKNDDLEERNDVSEIEELGTQTKEIHSLVKRNTLVEELKAQME
jgi:hypothetical protein